MISASFTKNSVSLVSSSSQVYLYGKQAEESEP